MTAHLSALGCTLATLVSSAPVVNATFGVFLVPISRDLHWTRAEVTSLLSITAAACALSYPLVGRAADRFGARRVAAIGNALFALAIASAALLGPARLPDMLLFAVLGVTAAIPSGVVFSKLVAGWYDRERGFVLGIVGGVGNGVGASAMPFVAAFAVGLWGWRAAYVAIGVLVFAVGQASIAILREPPAAVPPERGVAPGLAFGEAVRTRHFVAVLALAAFGAGALNAVFTHLIPMATDRGLSATEGAATMAVMALTGSAWQMAFGALLDRTGTPRIMAPVFLLAIPGIVLLAGAHSATPLFVGAVLAGLGLGTEYAAIPYLVSRYFGLRSFGAINGVASGINAVVIGATPTLVDLGYDRTGSYRDGIAGAALALVLAACLAMVMPRFARAKLTGVPPRSAARSG